MSFLLLYLGEGKPFDITKVKETLQRSACVKDLTEGNQGTKFKCEYHAHDDWTDVYVKDDPETIVIDGTGPASLEAALEIQRCYDEPIRVFNEGYTFDLVLSECDSLNDLVMKIQLAEE